MKRAILKPQIKMGAERKKVMFLIGLLVVLVISYLWSSSGSPSNSTGSTPAGPAVAKQLPGVPLPAQSKNSRGRGAGGRGGPSSAGQVQRGGALQEFRPTLKPKDPIDPSKVDPTLKLPLLARVKSVNVEGGGRSLFDFSTAPAAKAAEIAKVKPIMPGQKQMAFIGPVKPPPPAPPAPPPPPPPIPLKFYGFNTLKQGSKRAFFLEGEDIFVAGEGDLIKNRYKVVRIGVNSAVVEDTTNKHEQTLPLEAEQAAS